MHKHDHFLEEIPTPIHNIYNIQNVPWKPSTKWLFIPYRLVRFGAQKIWCLQQKMAKPSQTHCLLQMASPDPIFFQRMEAYTRVNPTHSVEEMARGMAVGFLYGPKHPNTFFLRAKFKQWKNATIRSACPLTTRSIARLHTATICSACPLTTRSVAQLHLWNFEFSTK